MHHMKYGRNQAANDLVIVSTCGKGQAAAILAAFLERQNKKNKCGLGNASENSR